MNFLTKTAVCALAASLSVTGMASAEEYPQRPVTMLEPWPPGDVDDQLLRIIAEEFDKETGVPAKVINRPGGFGVEGAQALASAQPDGYTIGNFLIDIPTSYIVQGFAPYQREDFEVIGLNMNYPFILAAAADAPYSNIAELAEYAKTNDVRLAHFGFETLPAQQTFEAARQYGFEFKTETGYDITDCSTLANGDADVMNSTVGLVLACKNDIKVLAAFTDEPLSVYPEAPLLKDQMEGPTFSLWSGLFVPAGTPQEIKDRIATIAEAAMQTESAKQIAETTGTEVYWQNAEDAQARIDANFEQIEALFANPTK